MPRVKPPRTVEKGLFEKPTVLNNVETYCNVPPIINKGAAWYKTIGPDKNHGTKSVCLNRKRYEYRTDRGSDGNTSSQSYF